MIAKPATEAGEYEVLDQYQSQPRRLKIIHVGAGASGLLLAYKAQRQLRNYELICYEKNPTYGGTWYENKYPGCACDIPAHVYTYTFQPNTEWSGFYSGADEIEQYFRRFHDQHNLAPYIRLDSEVVSATWLEDAGELQVKVKNAANENETTTITDRCNVLINGSGVVNKWKWPAIEGISSYKGTLAHSAKWDTSIDWQGKKVAVLGTGSSSIQMVPHLAKGKPLNTLFLP
ncbi:hypothetical protein A1O7_08324 [Cladophialophora yegresii CBS 114405]|uniref:Cyclohexanone monooxygenase n=1 Tax=Cladophialophora yegresii CBS 114405 TaxID=1182544 RepID=W9VIC5_9EURO|nr:uncharacterized protein A1O7_08324 [Cladophialophora yegresii CBS 114405]EXJ55397.1 hypothetical protein A1O7_08324 [Cladophialophora yegresii CBS 114405]